MLGFWPQLKAWLEMLFHGLAGWVFFSLLAIGFVYVNTVVSLVLAVIGGAALGLLLVMQFEKVFFTKARLRSLDRSGTPITRAAPARWSEP